MATYYNDEEVYVPENPDENYFRTIYERGGLTEIPEAEKAALVRRTSGHSPSVIPNQVVDIDAMAEAQRQREEPVQYIPFKPREENPDAPTIMGYGDKMLIRKSKDDMNLVNEWGERVSEEYARDVEAKATGAEPIPQKPPTDYEQYVEWMENARTQAKEFANRQVQAFKDRYTAVDESLMTPGQKAKYLEEQQREGSDAYKFAMGRASREYERQRRAEEINAKEMQKAAEQAEKDAKKEAEHIQKRQEKIEDDLRKGKITNLNNMEKEARSDLNSLLKIREKRMLESKSKHGLTEEEERQLAKVEQNIAEIVKKREAIYGGGTQTASPQTTTAKKLIGKKNGKPVYDLGNGKWQIGD